MNEVILKTKQLSKNYGNFKALDNANIEVHKKDIYGLVGRNGAGKTTLMKVITTLSKKSNGSFELLGEDDEHLGSSKSRIGCLIENPAFFNNMSIYDNLYYYSIQKGIVDKKQIDKAIELVNLTEFKKRKFKKLSLGMKQRLGIAFAIMDNPDFIILDEPINGLDPIGISELRDTFIRLSEQENVTIMISSHILSELYLVANKFCFIEQGKIIKEIGKEELDNECSKTIVIKTTDIKATSVVLETKLNTTNYKVIDKNEIRLYDYLDNAMAVNKVLVQNNINIMGIYEAGISLEEYFKNIIKEVK